MRRRNLVLGVLTVCLACTVCFFVWKVQSESRASGSTVLSGRAEEFIQKEQKNGANTWSLDKQETSSVRTEGSQISTECFSFITAFKTELERTEKDGERCLFSARVLSPPARLLVTAYERSGKFEEDTGIVLRRSQPEKYTERQIQSKTHQTVLAFSESEGVAVYIYDQPVIITLVFSSMQQPERLDWAKVTTMVDSLALVQ